MGKNNSPLWTLGILSSPLQEQLEGVLPEHKAKLFQAHYEAIFRLYLHGYISPTIKDRAMRRLSKEIDAAIASGIEARRAETGIPVSVGDESPGPKGDAPSPSHPQP